MSEGRAWKQRIGVVAFWWDVTHDRISSWGGLVFRSYGATGQQSSPVCGGPCRKAEHKDLFHLSLHREGLAVQAHRMERKN